MLPVLLGSKESIVAELLELGLDLCIVVLKKLAHVARHDIDAEAGVVRHDTCNTPRFDPPL